MSDVDPDLDAYLGDEDDDEDETIPTAARDSSTITQLRKRLRAETKARKAAEEKATANETYREQYLSIQTPKAFEEAGVDVRLAKVYPPDGERTAEAVKTWASGLGFAPSEAEPEPEAAQGGTFVPTVGGDVPGTQKVPRSTIDQLIKDGNMAEANRLMREGRVEWNNPDGVAAASR